MEKCLTSGVTAAIVIIPCPPTRRPIPEEEEDRLSQRPQQSRLRQVLPTTNTKSCAHKRTRSRRAAASISRLRGLVLDRSPWMTLQQRGCGQSPTYTRMDRRIQQSLALATLSTAKRIAIAKGDLLQEKMDRGLEI